MEAENLHNPDDTASFLWIIQCGRPIKPEDWTLSVPPAIHVAPYFTMNLTVAKGVKLPTKPIIRLTPIEGMQRIDNDISIDNSSSIKFAIQEPDGTLPNMFPQCEGVQGCHDHYVLDKMGLSEDQRSDAVEESDADGT